MMYSLADAIINEDYPAVSEILRHGTNVNQIDEYGFTPLIEAAIADNFDIAKLILSYGAQTNMQDMTGSTALHWAAENNNIMLSRLLLEQRADPNIYTLAGQPALVMPLLRRHDELKKLLIRHGADLVFAQDYINTKQLGHMFELVGTAHIVSPKNQFVEIDFEGFYLEFSLGMIAESVAQIENHFAARKLRRYAHLTRVIVDVINRTAQLIKYQQYRIDVKKHQTAILSLLQHEPLIIPIGYEGHAITFIKFGNILVKCDRREDSRLYDNVVFYQVNRPERLNYELIIHLIYDKQTSDFINIDLPELLQLTPITEIKVTAQISGNCSWANVEACIPALFFLLSSQAEEFQNEIPRYKSLALDFFHQWREWNKERALQFCIESFRHSDSIRKACKAEILAAILFQGCKNESTTDYARFETILSELIKGKFKHIIQNYVKSYCYEDHSEEGKHFLHMLKSHGYQDVG